MKIIRALFVIVGVVSVVATASLAVEKMSSKTKLIRVKADGATIAELRLFTKAPITFATTGPDGRAEYSEATGQLNARNGVIVRIGEAKHQIEIKADEVEVIPENN